MLGDRGREPEGGLRLLLLVTGSFYCGSGRHSQEAGCLVVHAVHSVRRSREEKGCEYLWAAQMTAGNTNLKGGAGSRTES